MEARQEAAQGLAQQAVQQAIARVDDLLGKARISEPLLNRQDHEVLTSDMKLIREYCMSRGE